MLSKHTNEFANGFSHILACRCEFSLHVRGRALETDDLLGSAPCIHKVVFEFLRPEEIALGPPLAASVFRDRGGGVVTGFSDPTEQPV
jgi:hypothetical protein